MKLSICLSLTALTILSGCVEAPASEPTRQGASFGQLLESLSEEGGYFDTDNLISNETSYLHAVTDLDERALAGGAYLGVGPGQNFSYIAALRPDVAIIVDIRRDNMLQHLLFKALFDLSPTPLAYLANLVGKTPLPAEDPRWTAVEIDSIVALVDGLSPLSESALDNLRQRIRGSIRNAGNDLDTSDLATVFRFHDAFRQEGLDLRFQSHYRSPQPYYPTLRRLLVERDRNGNQRSFLARREDYDFVRSMQAENRILPVVGDLAGPAALNNVGAYLRDLGLSVTAFYTSNVEFYLFQDRAFPRFVQNVDGLPRAENGILIRSYFNRFRATHPATLPGYASTQLVQTFDDFLEAARDGVSYNELMFR